MHDDWRYLLKSQCSCTAPSRRLRKVNEAIIWCLYTPWLWPQAGMLSITESSCMLLWLPASWTSVFDIRFNKARLWIGSFIKNTRELGKDLSKKLSCIWVVSFKSFRDLSWLQLCAGNRLSARWNLLRQRRDEALASDPRPHSQWMLESASLKDLKCTFRRYINKQHLLQ
jgi:hypothetical protein